LDPIGASPNEDGATITGTILKLQPASANYGGVVTTGAQTFAGAKTFNSDVKLKTIYYGQGTGTGYETNILISDHTLPNSTTGDNIIIGKGSGAAITTGTWNVVIGADSFALNTQGYSNTCVGKFSMAINTTGHNNTAVGVSSLSNNKVGAYNTAIGSGTLNTSTASNNNTAVGFQSMVNLTGNNNTAVGYSSCRFTKDDSNVAIGNFAMAGVNNEPNTNRENTVIGCNAMMYATSSNNNVVIGFNAALNLVTGDSNILIGSGANVSSSGNTGEIAIGYNLTGKGTNTAFIGGINGIYNQAGSGGVSVANWNNTSDARLKTNINNLPSGLSVICSLRPVEFDWITCNISDVGFIAQEYGQVLPEQLREYTPNESEKELVGDDTVKAINQNLNPYLVKAIQELKAEIEQLKATIKSLQ